MADHTTGIGTFASGESVSAFETLGAAAAATVTASSSAPIGVATFVGLKPNRQYTLVGATSGKTLKIFTGEEGLAQAPLNQAFREISIVFDAASVNAATGASQNLTAPAGTVAVGDTVVFLGRSGTSGAVSCSVGPIATADTIPVLFVNGTAAGIDLASQTYRFLVIRKRTNL